MAADLVVSEIMYQATSRSEGDEWIELYNRGTTPANLGVNTWSSPPTSVASGPSTRA